MKKAKKFIALFTAAVMVFASVTVASAGIANHKSYSGSPMSPIGTTVPETGIADVDKAIMDFVNGFAGSNAPALDEGDYLVCKWSEGGSDSGRYVFIDIEIMLASSMLTGSKKTVYVDTESGKVIDKAAYDAGIAAEEAAAAEAEEEEAEEEEEEEEEFELTQEQLDALVPLRSTLEALGFELAWNSEVRGVEVTLDGETVVMLMVGVDAYVISDDDYVELGVAPVIREDGFTYVPVSFFAELLGLYIIVDGGEVAGFAIIDEDGKILATVLLDGASEVETSEEEAEEE